jgi:hypothetical protein
MCPIAISEITFDRELKQGAFYLTNICNGACGRWFSVIIEKSNGNWDIVRVKNVGIL